MRVRPVTASPPPDVKDRLDISWADHQGAQERKFRDIEIAARIHGLDRRGIYRECRDAGIVVDGRSIESLREALVDVLRARR